MMGPFRRLMNRVASIGRRDEFRAREGNIDDVLGVKKRPTRVSTANFTRQSRHRVSWPRSWEDVNQERTFD